MRCGDLDAPVDGGPRWRCCGWDRRSGDGIDIEKVAMLGAGEES